jgi:hypothetical protein
MNILSFWLRISIAGLFIVAGIKSISDKEINSGVASLALAVVALQFYREHQYSYAYFSLFLGINLTLIRQIRLLWVGAVTYRANSKFIYRLVVLHKSSGLPNFG